MSAGNLAVYNRPDVAAHYAVLDYLTPCEKALFDEYIGPGLAVLDLGVGGGRTTPYLASKASRYVGIDYADEMVQSCRKKYPDLEFRLTDASNLSCFSDATFDAIVCAFNGIDYVIPDEARASCFRECNRLLRTGGIFLFSSHNPRSILIRSGWNQQRVRELAIKLARSRRWLLESMIPVLNLAGITLATYRSTWASIVRIFERVPRLAFWNGEGYLFDRSHGGLLTHCWIPARVIEELQRYGFHCEKMLGNDYPARNRLYSTEWYYYVFVKVKAENGAPCA